MPYFSVLVEGSGFNIPGTFGEPPIVGFAVSRVVRARGASAASELVLSSVIAEWSSGRFSHFKVTPVVATSEVNRVGLLSGIFSKPQGYIFHPAT